MADLGFSSTWLDALDKTMDHLQAATFHGINEAAYHLHQQVVARAQNTAGWAEVADEIETWSEDGYMVVGFSQEDFISQAALLEYGTEEIPPSPLFRTLTAEVRHASSVYHETMKHMVGMGSIIEGSG